MKNFERNIFIYSQVLYWVCTFHRNENAFIYILTHARRNNYCAFLFMRVYTIFFFFFFRLFFFLSILFSFFYCYLWMFVFFATCLCIGLLLLFLLLIVCSLYFFHVTRFPFFSMGASGVFLFSALASLTAATHWTFFTRTHMLTCYHYKSVIIMEVNITNGNEVH